MQEFIINEELYKLPRGLSLAEMIDRAELATDRIVAALIDNQVRRLDYVPEKSCRITTVSRGDELGNRIYRRSLFSASGQSCLRIIS